LAQPLLDLLARQPEFLVVRGASPWEVAGLLVGLLLVAPLPLLALRLAAAPLGERAGRRVQAALLGAMAALLALQAVRESGGAWWWLAPLAAGAAVGVVFLRVAAVRLYASFLAPAVLVVPLLFLFHPGVRRALAPGGGEGIVLGEVAATAPVVLVIFDELPLAALLDGHGAIDAERFPNFAALAARATWFRNAVAVSDATQIAVPAMLSGRIPQRGDLPFVSDFPVNLFTVLGGSYEVWVEESLTRLCPPEINRIEEAHRSLWRRVQATFADVGVVWLHLTLPPRLADELPRIDRTWGGFTGPGGGEPLAVADRGTLREVEVAAMAGLAGRHERHRALPSLIAPEPRRLYFFHVLLPHAPWEYLPSGEHYLRVNDDFPPRDQIWPDSRAIVAQGYGRFLLQLGYTDRWLGEVVSRLEDQGAFDRALLVVTADHGTSFVPGVNQRFYAAGNLAELAAVPLLVKAPGQRHGEVVERPVSGVDLLPTLLEVLAVPPPSGLDGQSAFATAPRRLPLPFVPHHGQRSIALPADLPRQVLAASQRLRRLVPDGPDGPFRAGPFPELLGKPVSGLATAGSEAVRLVLHELPSGPRPAGALPLLVSGLVDLPQVPPRSALAVALDGVVVATSSLLSDSAGRPRFTVLLPVEAARHGPERRAYFLLQRTAGGLRARPLLHEKMGGRLGVDASGEPRVVLGGRRYRLDPELSGWIHEVALEGGALQVSGWAVDRHAVGPAERVAVFLGGRLLGTALPTMPTDGVVDLLGDPRYLDSTFSAWLPPVDPEELAKRGARLFALSRRGTAGELRMVHPARRLDSTPSGEALRAANGRSLPVRPGAIRFSLDGVTETPDQLLVSGWAVDVEEGGAAVQLVGVLAGEVMAAYYTGGERPDVGRALEAAPAATSGFALPIPRDRVPAAQAGRLRVFAISDRRPVATELPLASFLAEQIAP
ncbi:MAG TPA: sulfatase-like hydrolase/transferase, partial [Thermoanaerobaculia bacterium]|nr:sulfatase-like hydrolase/transferase [Thermoanaerobaculia bacterium]